MNRKERFLNKFQGKDVDMTPVGSTTTYAVAAFGEAFGKERPEADLDPAVMAEWALQGPKLCGWEWVKAMGWDIIPLSEALGVELGQPTRDTQYYVKGHPYAESLEGLEYPSDFLKRGRFPVYKEQFRILKEKVGDEMVVFGESEGAFTAAANLVGTEKFMKWCFKEPDQVNQVLEVTKQAAIDAANFAFDQGADYYVYAEPTSGPALLSPRMYKKIVLPLEQEIISKVKGPVVLHICANADPVVPMMCETGAVGISIEEKADMKAAKEIASQKGVRVFGNVATATTLFNGTPEECYQEARQALENGTDFLCPGCGVSPLSSIENLVQLRKARDDAFGVKSEWTD
ncbi:MAG: uroporphyrinogen decarboxylase family protein [Desulfarculaceae bacterium]|jgi:[methyl-Co(III) methanol-specific corrinoid protein]:coenzyme M methyltransferase